MRKPSSCLMSTWLASESSTFGPAATRNRETLAGIRFPVTSAPRDVVVPSTTAMCLTPLLVINSAQQENRGEEHRAEQRHHPEPLLPHPLDELPANHRPDLMHGTPRAPVRAGVAASGPTRSMKILFNEVSASSKRDRRAPELTKALRISCASAFGASSSSAYWLGLSGFGHEPGVGENPGRVAARAIKSDQDMATAVRPLHGFRHGAIDEFLASATIATWSEYFSGLLHDVGRTAEWSCRATADRTACPSTLGR